MGFYDSFVRVSPESPCQRCGRGDWCLYHRSGRWGVCARFPSGKPIGVAGWRYEVRRRVKVDAVIGDKEYLDPAEVARVWRRSRRAMTRDRQIELAATLNVDYRALDWLGYGYDLGSDAYTVPFRSYRGQIIGLQYRSGGAKWSLTGSQFGLFLPRNHYNLRNELLLCPEGASDTAAILSLGFAVIGRPNCRIGGSHVAEYIRTYPRWVRGPSVVIVADRDANGVGLEAALDISWDIPYSCVIVPRKHKDAREVAAAGCDRADIIRCIETGASVYWELCEEKTRPHSPSFRPRSLSCD